MYGTFELLSPDDERIFAFRRADSVLVVLNFSPDTVDYQYLGDTTNAKVIKETQPGAIGIQGGMLRLQPYSGAMLGL